MRILSTGSYLPETIFTNEYMEKLVDTSDEWIVSHSGIRERRILKDGRSVEMAEAAARNALKMAGISAKDLGAVICATVTPDNIVPSMACELISRLGIVCPAFDINAACTGFLYALKVAEVFVSEEKPVLVLGVETLSKVTDYKDRSTCILFGDGAGAAIVGAGEGIMHMELNAYGDPDECLTIAGVGKENISRTHYIRMRGQEVFKFATREISKLAERSLDATGLLASDIDWIIPHQANIRIIDSAIRRMKISKERFIINIEGVGNTSAASIPLALDQANREGKFKDGDIILILGFGGGLTSGVAMIKWKESAGLAQKA